MSDANKGVISRLIEVVVNRGEIALTDELYTPELAPAAHRWIEPFRIAFPDLEMQAIELVSEGERVVGRFRCSRHQPRAVAWRGPDWPADARHRRGLLLHGPRRADR